ncbi:MAG: hypothetical protein DMG96_38210 [Acidobacteria bacterium]|nr:MAG: hypothetical protein DMG96_38210 [Acidobacteriota bacterium]
MSPILLTSVSALSTLIGGWARTTPRAFAARFRAGARLGATFSDLLPEAISAANRRGWSTQRELVHWL